MAIDFNLIMVLDFVKGLIGFIYIFLEYKAMRSLWIANILMSALGMCIYYMKGIYADFAINIYYLIIGIYGFMTWGKTKKEKPEVQITHVNLPVGAMLLVAWLAMWGLIAWVLATFTNSTVVWLDSFTTSLCIIAMWMLSRKYIEQWWLWFVVDAVSVYLYYYKGIYFSGTLYAFYTVMAVLGYFRWRRMMRAQTPAYS